jgi:hypothetical protein
MAADKLDKHLQEALQLLLKKEQAEKDKGLFILLLLNIPKIALAKTFADLSPEEQTQVTTLGKVTTGGAEFAQDRSTIGLPIPTHITGAADTPVDTVKEKIKWPPTFTPWDKS